MKSKEILKVMQVFFCSICQHIIYQVIKGGQLWNMDETRFIQKQNSHKVVVLKGSNNVCSKSTEANFHMTFFECVSAAEPLIPPLFIFPVKRMNIDVL